MTLHALTKLSDDEVKDLHDKAEAMRVYARKARDWEFDWWAE